jgi:large repetitive protein
LPLNQNLTINSGDTVTTSYAVSMPGNHGAATVKYPYGFAETDVSCPDHTSYTLTIPAVSQSFTIPANDNSVQSSAPGSATNPGCSNGGPGQTTGGYFYALGIQNPGAGNPGMSGFTTTDGTPATAQTDPLNVTFSLSDSTTGQGGASAPTTTLNWQNPYSCTPPGCPLTPTITWPAPSTMIYGTPLSSAQLNATATATQISGLQAPGTSGLLTPVSVPGTFTYTPAAGTVPVSGMQTLSVTFTPTNIGTKYTNFTIATASVPILVGTVTITTTGALSKIADEYQMVVTVKNTGNVTAANVQLTQAILGAANGATIPAPLGDIPSGGSASVTLTFPSSSRSRWSSCRGEVVWHLHWRNLWRLVPRNPALTDS